MKKLMFLIAFFAIVSFIALVPAASAGQSLPSVEVVTPTTGLSGAITTNIASPDIQTLTCCQNELPNLQVNNLACCKTELPMAIALSGHGSGVYALNDVFKANGGNGLTVALGGNMPTGTATTNIA